MSTLWDVPQYLIMAFSLALDAPAEKASRVLYTPQPSQSATAPRTSAEVPGEDFWLRAVKTAAPHSSVLQIYGARIFVTTAGRYYVPTLAERAEILALRKNQDVAARVLAAATRTLQDDLEAKVHEKPTRGALLVAHLLGEAAGVRYMQALAHDPDGKAIAAIPQLAAFMDGDKGLTLEQLDARIERSMTPRATEVAVPSDEALKGTLTKPEINAAEKFASR